MGHGGCMGCIAAAMVPSETHHLVVRSGCEWNARHPSAQCPPRPEEAPTTSSNSNIQHPSLRIFVPPCSPVSTFLRSLYGRHTRIPLRHSGRLATDSGGQEQRVAAHSLIPPSRDDGHLLALRGTDPPDCAHAVLVASHRATNIQAARVEHRGVAAVVSRRNERGGRLRGAGCRTESSNRTPVQRQPLRHGPSSAAPPIHTNHRSCLRAGHKERLVD
eukprot:scaffold7170_cov119-Isochrysis_galbana.AAC.2